MGRSALNFLAMDQGVWSVTQLTQAIKGQLEQRFNYVQIKGEISNLKIQASGHVYFTLKDAGSQISSVLFRGNTKGLSRMHAMAMRWFVRVRSASIHPAVSIN